MSQPQFQIWNILSTFPSLILFVESALHQSTDGYFSFIGVRWATSDPKRFKDHFRLESLMKGDYMTLSSLIHKNGHDLIEDLNGHNHKAKKGL